MLHFFVDLSCFCSNICVARNSPMRSEWLEDCWVQKMRLTCSTKTTTSIQTHKLSRYNRSSHLHGHKKSDSGPEFTHLCCLLEKSTLIKFQGFRETVSLLGPLDGPIVRVCIRAGLFCLKASGSQGFAPSILSSSHTFIQTFLHRPFKPSRFVTVYFSQRFPLTGDNTQVSGYSAGVSAHLLHSFLLQADLLQPDSPEGRHTGGLW